MKSGFRPVFALRPAPAPAGAQPAFGGRRASAIGLHRRRRA